MLLLLSSLALVAACSPEDSSGSDSDDETSESSSESSSSSSFSSSADDEEVWSPTLDNSGPLTWAAETDDSYIPDVKNDSTTNSYVVTAAPGKDSEITVYGTLEEGYIVVNLNDNPTSDDTDVEINFYEDSSITCSTHPCIYFSGTSNKLKVKAQKKKTATLTCTSSEYSAIESENNVEIKGKGTLNINSACHGVDADRIELTSEATINVTSTKDGLHGHKLHLQEFGGTLTINASTQALDFSHNDAGEILFADEDNTCYGSFELNSGKGNWTIDNSFTIPEGVTITGTDSKNRVAENEGSDEATITIEGSYTLNETELSTTTIASGAKWELS